MTSTAHGLRMRSQRAAVITTMDDIAAAWRLDLTEQAQALGVDEATWSAVLADHRSPLPPEIHERAGYLWNLRRMLSELSDDSDAQEFFLREAGILGASSPLARATSDIASLKALCAEVNAIAGEGICPDPFSWSPNAMPGWLN